MTTLPLPHVWRLSCAFVMCCAFVMLSAQAEAQPKTPEEIEAEMAGRFPSQAVPPAPPLALPIPSPGAVSEPDQASGARRQEIERELTELTRQAPRTSLGLPIGGMVVGLGGAVLMLSAAVEATDEERAVGGLRLGLGLGAVAMLGVGIASHAWLRSRISHRREYRRRTTALQIELSTLTGSSSDRALARARRERLGELDRELDAVRSEYGQYGLAAPIVLTSVGFGLAGPLLFVGVLASMFGDDAAPLFLLPAVMSALVGVVGLIWLGHRKRLRKPLGDRIRALEGEKRALMPVSFDLELRREHALLSLKVQF